MIKYVRGNSNTETNVTVEVRKDGSVNVDINVGSLVQDASPCKILVMAHLNTPVMQIALSHTMEALRHQWPMADFMLDLPYVPYARQDRRCNPGEALGIKVFGDYINSLKFDVVMITDPHSAVTEACIERSHVVNQIETFQYELDYGKFYIVAPDLGAMKKAEAFAKAVGALGVVTCYKERNLYTGDIVSQGLIGGENIPENANFFVLDDICDGGRTFVGVAELLMPMSPNKLYLGVTHGIFSYGADVVTQVYDRVYTTNSFNPDLKSENNLFVLKIK